MKKLLLSIFLILATSQVLAITEDINSDGIVNLADLMMVVADFGKSSGFDPKVDLAPPVGEINLFDVMKIITNWGINTASNTTNSTTVSVMIMNPTNGSKVSNTITITTNVSGQMAISGLQFELNGLNIGIEDNTAPYILSWNSRTVPNGTYELSAVARDASGNMIASTIEINVQNMPIAPINTSDNSHDYFNQLKTRPDVFVYNGIPMAISFRNSTEVTLYRKPSGTTDPDFTYDYLGDPDPRRQDAMKIRVKEGKIGTQEQIIFNVGPSQGQSMMITADFWWGSEYHTNHSLLNLMKGTPITIYHEGDRGWAGLRTDFAMVNQQVSTQPDGGPFVLFYYNQGMGKGPIVKTPDWWIDGMSGYPRLRLPYDAPFKQQRTYGEGIAPVDTSVDPGGMEMGVVAERWTRVWHYFERAPEEDWLSEYPSINGTPMNAYRLHMWFADTARDPVKVINGAVIGIPASLTKQITTARMEFTGGNANIGTIYEGRGDLIAYARNVVVLHGTSLNDVESLIQKPK